MTVAGLLMIKRPGGGRSFYVLQDGAGRIQLMAQRLGNLDNYRIPAIGITGHDPSRWEYGRPWIQALNTGDPRGHGVARR